MVGGIFRRARIGSGNIMNNSLIPLSHPGLHYKTFMSQLSRVRGGRVYLEIGVQVGLLLSEIHTDHAVAVDPNFRISHNITANKKSVYLYNDISDRFFNDPKAKDILDGSIDLAFLDGLHVFEYLLRDFCNTEARSSRDGLIVMHDCLPLNAEMTIRDEATSIEKGKNTLFPNYWTGDVWKVVSILQKYRPDLKVVCLNSHPTGLVCVSNLDPNSQSLRDNYLSIVEEYRNIPYGVDSLNNFYSNMSIEYADTVANGFDHSLFFKV